MRQNMKHKNDNCKNKKHGAASLPPRFVAGFLLLGVTKKYMRCSRAFQKSHNRTVYASPPVGGSGYEKPQSAYGLCAFFLRHIWGGGQCFALPYYPPQTSYTFA
jgi:hypothetical protein